MRATAPSREPALCSREGQGLLGAGHGQPLRERGLVPGVLRYALGAFIDGVASWRYAENTGCGLSAEAMVATWLDSVYHRVNILDEDFRDMGVGVSQRRVAGRCQKAYGTFTVVFGERSQ